MTNVFGEQLQIADAIREVRARGCTTPGVAELIVEYHGALKVLGDLDHAQQLGEELAKDPDSPLGAKMRALLADAAAKEVKAEPTPIVDVTERAVQHVMKAGYSEDAARQIVKEHGADTVLEGEEIAAKEKEEAVQWLIEVHKYSEPTAREIVEKEGAAVILGEKRHSQVHPPSETAAANSPAAANTVASAAAASSSSPGGSQPAADVTEGTGAGSVQDAAVTQANAETAAESSANKTT